MLSEIRQEIAELKRADRQPEKIQLTRQEVISLLNKLTLAEMDTAVSLLPAQTEDAEPNIMGIPVEIVDSPVTPKVKSAERPLWLPKR